MHNYPCNKFLGAQPVPGCAPHIFAALQCGVIYKETALWRFLYQCFGTFRNSRGVIIGAAPVPGAVRQAEAALGV